MKNKRYPAVFAAGLMLSAFAGCSSTNSTAPSDQSAVPTENVTNISPESVVFDWQSAYEQVLNEFKKSQDFVPTGNYTGTMFDIMDLNSDGTPELIITPDSSAGSKAKIYTFSGGSAAMVGNGDIQGNLSYIPEQNVINFDYIGDGFTVGEYDSINGTSLVQLKNYFDNSMSASRGGTLQFKIDHAEVLYPEFEEALRIYRDYPSISAGRKFSYSDAGINYAIHFAQSWGAVLSADQKKLYVEKLTELMNTAGDYAAFDLADLDNDSIPELIFSEGIDTSSKSHIFKLDTNGISEIGTGFGSYGVLKFDISKNVICFYDDTNQLNAFSMTGENTSGFVLSDSTMECGRKYILCDISIAAALS